MGLGLWVLVVSGYAGTYISVQFSVGIGIDLIISQLEPPNVYEEGEYTPTASREPGTFCQL